MDMDARMADATSFAIDSAGASTPSDTFVYAERIVAREKTLPASGTPRARTTLRTASTPQSLRSCCGTSGMMMVESTGRPSGERSDKNRAARWRTASDGRFGWRLSSMDTGALESGCQNAMKWSGGRCTTPAMGPDAGGCLLRAAVPRAQKAANSDGPRM